MNINLTNYETAFLLYVDGELSPKDRMAVDQFVNANPQLRPKLKELQETKLTQENILFSHKEWLHRTTELPIEDDLTEQLLLLMDGELEGEAKNKLTTLLRTDEEALKKFKQISRVKLPEIFIPMPGKEKLLRGKSLDKKGSPDEDIQEMILDFLDEELTEKQQQAITSQLISGSREKKIADQLIKCKLEAPHISYPNKEQLFRQKPHRSVYLYPYRYWAAAALLTGAIAIALLRMETNKQPLSKTENKLTISSNSTPIFRNNKLKISKVSSNHANSSYTLTEHPSGKKGNPNWHLHRNNSQRQIDLVIIPQQKTIAQNTIESLKEPAINKTLDPSSAEVVKLEESNLVAAQKEIKTSHIRIVDTRDNNPDRIHIAGITINKNKIRSYFRSKIGWIKKTALPDNDKEENRDLWTSK